MPEGTPPRAASNASSTGDPRLDAAFKALLAELEANGTRAAAQAAIAQAEATGEDPGVLFEQNGGAQKYREAATTSGYIAYARRRCLALVAKGACSCNERHKPTVCVRCDTCRRHLCECPTVARNPEAPMPRRMEPVTPVSPLRPALEPRVPASPLWLALQEPIRRESVTLISARAGVDRKVVQRLRYSERVESRTAAKIADAAGLNLDDVYAVADGPPCECTEHWTCPGCRQWEAAA